MSWLQSQIARYENLIDSTPKKTLSAAVRNGVMKLGFAASLFFCVAAGAVDYASNKKHQALEQNRQALAEYFTQIHSTIYVPTSGSLLDEIMPVYQMQSRFSACADAANFAEQEFRKQIRQLESYKDSLSTDNPVAVLEDVKDLYAQVPVTLGQIVSSTAHHLVRKQYYFDFDHATSSSDDYAKFTPHRSMMMNLLLHASCSETGRDSFLVGYTTSEGALSHFHELPFDWVRAAQYDSLVSENTANIMGKMDSIPGIRAFIK